jgi:hypothetical protein
VGSPKFRSWVMRPNAAGQSHEHSLGRRMRITPPLQGGESAAFPGRRCASPPPQHAKTACRGPRARGYFRSVPLGREAAFGRQTEAPSKIEIMVVGRCKRGRGRPRDSRPGGRRYRGAIFIPGCEPKDHERLISRRLSGTRDCRSMNGAQFHPSTFYCSWVGFAGGQL